VTAVRVGGLLSASMSVLAKDQAAAAGPPPEGKLEMLGDIGDFVPGVVDDPVHDPTLFEDHNIYYVFST
jgi:arabinan endo-1,5-alpha-L-arabinosidase